LADQAPRPRLSDLELSRLGAVVESSDDAIISKDLDGTIRTWNLAAERIFGYPLEEMIGQPIFRLIPKELHDEEQQLLARIRAGEHVAHYETTRIRKDGQRIQISLTLSPVRDSEGRLIGASAIKRDITAQRGLERQLHHSQQMDAVGQLAAGVAHDFNNILTVISGYCGLLLARTRVPDPRRDDIIGIQEAADRAAALTQQLLAFGRKQVIQPQVLDLREVIEDTGRMLRRLLGEHIDLAITTGPLLSPVFADRGQLSQVLINLAVNARDAMPQGGHLTIAAQDVPLSEEYASTHLEVMPGLYVRIAVSDTGVGMTPEIQARMFEPFFTTKPAGKGTGLGLSTVYGIVKQLGGHMFVYSEPEQGTTIKIYLRRAEDAAVAEAPPEQPISGRESATILVVEDDPGIRGVIRRVLEEQGYPVLLAATPQLALELAAGHEGPIHLLLTDVVMPEMSGRQLAERLVRDWPGLPVLFMSGYTGDAIVHQGRLDPDTELLQKPFTADTLLRRIRRVLYPGGSEPPSS
jgi:PAS domain S-box-containing protein